MHMYIPMYLFVMLIMLLMLCTYVMLCAYVAFEHCAPNLQSGICMIKRVFKIHSTSIPISQNSGFFKQYIVT